MIGDDGCAGLMSANGSGDDASKFRLVGIQRLDVEVEVEGDRLSRLNCDGDREVSGLLASANSVSDTDRSCP